jgi:hypothetical protein
MSLQLAAQRLAAQGRGGDTTLVHMTPREVAGLQALALRGGTSLTINPQTGLPEAFKLKELLPAVAGFALGPAGFGLMSSLGAAATVGGLTALTSGSLSKGLMAGMGAYGGSSLGEGLLGAGIGAAQDAAMSGLGEGASQAARNEAAAAASRDFASRGVMDRLGSGLSASAANPSSLVSSLGGGAKALQAGYMLAAPILADQAVQTTTKMPTTDTGYIRPYTGWNPQTLSFRAEEPIRASSVRMAGGGTTNRRTSQEAFDYLMGKTPARTPAPVVVQGFQGPNEIAGTGGKYVFDPATGTYKFVADTTTSTATGTTNSGFLNRFGPDAGGDATPTADANAPGPTGVSTTSMGPVASAAQIGLGALANALSPTNPNAAPAPVSDVNNAANSSAAQDSASQASNTAPTATTGSSGTGGAAATAGAAAASAAAAAGMSAEAQAAAGQAAVDATLSGLSPTQAAEQGHAAAVSVAIGEVNAAAASTIGEVSMDAPGQGANSGPAAPGGGEAPSVGDAPGTGASDGSGPGAGAGTGGAAPGDSGDGGTGAASSAGGDGGAGAGDGGAAGDGGVGAGDGSGWASGGLAHLARGGMQSNAFVVPADVMSALGNGSTKAGLAALNARLAKLAGGGATLIQGPGDGLSDSIPTSIDGRKPARVADGEAYIDPRIVQRLGGGSTDKGSAKLYKMMDKIRQQAHGKKTQQRPVKADRVLA